MVQSEAATASASPSSRHENGPPKIVYGSPDADQPMKRGAEEDEEPGEVQMTQAGKDGDQVVESPNVIDGVWGPVDVPCCDHAGRFGVA